MKYNNNRIKFDKESGFASLLIAMVLILVLSLMTVGFAFLMNKAQRSALDKQLSSQAYYAAESGVNDATKAIAAGYNAAKTVCGTSGVVGGQSGASYLNDNKVGTSTEAEYTCLLIDMLPKSLEYGSINTDSNEVITLRGSDPTGADQTIKTIKFSWQDAQGSTSFPTTPGTYPTSANWGTNTGMLRASITQILPGLGDAAHTFVTGYFSAYPLRTATPTAPSSPITDTQLFGAGAALNGGCHTSNTPRYCSITITGLNATNYLLRLNSIYRNSQVTITAYGGTGSVSTSNQLNLKESQAMIDSTGKAQDVLRRIQVRVPLKNTYDYPTYAAEAAGGICKQISVAPNEGDRTCN